MPVPNPTHTFALRLARGHGSGLALGLSFALVFSRSLATLLYDVRPADPATFGGVTLVLMATAVAASAIPARRAAALDPMMVLRAD